jgi:hypothetical protein
VPKGFEYPADGMIAPYAAARFGELQVRGEDAAETSLRSFLLGALQQLGFPDVFSKQQVEYLLLFLQAAITGSLGDTDEIDVSAEQTILEASESNYLRARSQLRRLTHRLRWGAQLKLPASVSTPASFDALREPIRNIAAVLRSGPWRTVMFVQLLHALHRTAAAARDDQKNPFEVFDTSLYDREVISPTETPMRFIVVSTEVFGQIWSLRSPGEETEDAILRRVLPGRNDPEAPEVLTSLAPHGVVDRRNGVRFPEGFEIFRTYLGKDYQARASGGAWVLQSDGQTYTSLNELSRAIGTKGENAWVNWLFLGSDGNRKPVSDLRDRSRIGRRKIEPGAMEPPAEGRSATTASGANETAHASDTYATWRDDVRAALSQLGGKGSLHRIYGQVEQIRRGAGRSIPRTFDSTVRKTLEHHSSDSANYRGGLDLFYMSNGPGAGIWALRDRAAPRGKA